MDRYSKIHKSKWQSKYSEEFKRRICQEYLDGSIAIRALEQKYKLGNSRITFWLKSYGLELKKTIYLPSVIMPVKKESVLKSDDSDSIRLLKKQLEDALLEKELYRRMIEVAERDLKINIRKKSGTK